jgi:putative transposon-encoded protein
MSDTIWKFVVPLGEVVKIELPIGSKFRHVGIDPASLQPAVWVQVNPKVEVMGQRQLTVFGTGHPIDLGWNYVGTTIDGEFVWHIFERSFA